MSEIKVDTLTGKTTANDITVTVGASATQSLEQGLAKHWTNFDGSAATVTPRDSLNNSSITDHGTGQFSMNFSNSFNNANYVGSGMSGSDGTTFGQARDLFINVTSPATSAFRIGTKQSNDGSNVNDPQIHVLNTGDLA